MLTISTGDKHKMTFFGLTNLWIIGSYIGCFLTVIACCYIGIKAKNLNDDESDE